MLLGDLVGVIETLKQRIQAHGATLRENETRTRMALIDPLLAALGWDVSDPAVVTPEYALGNGRADYALLSERGTAMAFIEAKHLGEPLERPQHEEQVFTYALRQQVKYAALTDGDRWILDDVSVFTGERRTLDLSIAHTPAHQCALKLLLLWRPNLASGRVVPAEEPVFMNEQPRDVQTPPPPDPPPPFPSNGWLALSDLIVQRGNDPPQAIRFPDGSKQTVSKWRDLLTIAVAWVWSKGYLKIADIPRRLGGRRYLIHTEPVHPTGKKFGGPVPIVNTPLHVEANLSSPDCAKHTINLLVSCGVNSDTVQLRVGE